jgi:hypothetical protein
MSTDELKLASIMVLLFLAYTWLLRQELRRSFQIFLFALATGFLAQLPLGEELNRYTPNITIYISYVSLAVVITWGAGLTSVYSVHLWLARVCRKPPHFGFYALCGIPILIFLEWVGSNFIRMKLYGYTRFASLMPYLNAMHAPAWLYAYYIAVAILFFYMLKFLRLYGASEVPVIRPDAAEREEGAE